jgi:hypothetical protein
MDAREAEAILKRRFESYVIGGRVDMIAEDADAIAAIRAELARLRGVVARLEREKAHAIHVGAEWLRECRFQDGKTASDEEARAELQQEVRTRMVRSAGLDARVAPPPLTP